jgi:hypothetical protein
MDTGVDPRADFARYAFGAWQKGNPVPADKARWGSFNELDQFNQLALKGILEAAAAGPRKPGSVEQKVGDFFRSAIHRNPFAERRAGERFGCARESDMGATHSQGLRSRSAGMPQVQRSDAGYCADRGSWNYPPHPRSLGIVGADYHRAKSATRSRELAPVRRPATDPERGGLLRREFVLRNFGQALGFMTELALHAERKNHHRATSTTGSASR